LLTALVAAAAAAVGVVAICVDMAVFLVYVNEGLCS
jgi:hypothetical protein